MLKSIQTLAQTALKKHPFITNSIIYGSFYVAAEFSQQTIRKKTTEVEPPYDFENMKRYGIIGTFFYSPTLVVWYKWLDKKYPSQATKVVVKKLLLDQFTVTPLLIVGFFTAFSALEGKSDIFEECRQKFIPTFGTSCIFWIPAQALNFSIVPPTYRIVYIATCAFAWINILCFIKRQEIPEGKVKNDEIS